MALSTENRPDWLTDEAIAELLAALEACDNPYTQEEIDEIELDGAFDSARYCAYNAKRILTKYGIL